MTHRVGRAGRLGATLVVISMLVWAGMSAGATASAEATAVKPVASSTASSAAATTAIFPANVAPAAGAYVALPPARLLDTRTGTGARKGPVAAGSKVIVQVLGRAGVPTSGVGSVVLSLTVTQPAGTGNVRAWPDGKPQPGTSNLNYTRGRTVANAAVVPVGADGRIAILNADSQAQLIADVTGFYRAGTATAAGAFVALPSQRLLDTRSGVGAPRHAITAKGKLRVKIAGRGGVPAGVTSVVLNLTAVSPRGIGYIVAWDGGPGFPSTSNLDFVVGQTVANLAYVPVGPDGVIGLSNTSGGTVDLLADVEGYFMPGAAELPGTYVPVDPARVLDTRQKSGSIYSPVPPSGVISLYVPGQYSFAIPLDGVSAVVMNLTATAPRATGYVTAWAAGAIRPFTSNVDFAPGATVANFATVSIGTGDSIELYNGSPGTVQLLADVTGYYLSTQISHLEPGWGQRTAPIPITGLNLLTSCVSASFCEGVDPGGQTFRFDGQNWSPQSALVPKVAIESISCASTTFCVAMDEQGWAFTYTADGWSAPVAIPQHQGFQSVSCVSSTFCMAVNPEANTAAIYDGSGWIDSTPFASEAPYIGAVACGSPTSCFAINGASLYWYRGGTLGWSKQAAFPSGAVEGAVACSGPDLCVVTDRSGNAVTFNGTTWSKPVLLSADLAQSGFGLPVSCGPGFCVAVDHVGRSFRFDGTRWSVTPSGGEGASTISCGAASFCAVINAAGNGYTLDGTDWSGPIFADPVTLLNDLSCSSATSCTAVSRGGQAWTFDGNSWSAPTSVDRNGYLQAVSCPVDGFCAAVDRAGNAVISSGGTWTTPEKVDGIIGTKTISCASATFCVLMDSAGYAAVMQGTTWGPLTAIAPGHVMTAVSCPSSTFCAAIALDGYATIFDGQSWTVPARARVGSLAAISCPVVGFCVATSIGQSWSSDTSAVLYSDGAWHPQSPGTPGFRTISCASVLLCLAGGGHQYRGIFNGAAWSIEDTSIEPEVAKVSCPTIKFCAVLDWENGIYIDRS